jgi:hypothetical protein
MSTEQNQATNQTTDLNVNKSRVITCFIYYNDDDDLPKIFEVIKDFRVRHGLKFSHHSGYIFFTILSDHLNELAKVRPFKISKYQTNSEYTCTKEVADKLMEQKDSFIRMVWNENETLTFSSRTMHRVHSNLVRRIFKDSNQEFIVDSYQVLRNNSKFDNDEHNVQYTHSTYSTNSTHNNDGFVKVEKKVKKDSNTEFKQRTPRDKSKYNSNNSRQTNDATEEPVTPRVRGTRVSK